MLCNISLTHRELGNFDEAVAAAREALEIKPGHSATINALALSLQKQRRSSEATQLLEDLIASNPNDRDAYCNLGVIYLDRGDVEKALASLKIGNQNEPHRVDTYSNLLLTATYHDAISPRELYELHASFPSCLESAAPLPKKLKDPTRRRIRVGYVSPDFRTHSVVFFSCPVLMNHNCDDFDIYCYSDVKRPDNVTLLLQSFGHQWREIANRSNEDVLRMIEQDEIDILVDLTGHTSENRMALFGARAAPIQVTMIGYPNTSGLRTMDYQITDPVLHPPKATESFATETLVRLPIFAVYRPPENAPPVAPLPALKAGHVTFGYFNNLAKLRRPVLELWAQIAESAPGSQFLIQTSALGDEAIAKLISDRCGEAGLPLDRVQLKGESNLSQFHNDMHHVDIALDPFPFNGHTTSCQILHMGVPVVTLAGVSRQSRMGASLLTNLGLRELIATRPEEYVKIAAELAGDIPRLSAIRSSLRRRMETSPIMDGVAYTRHLENAYRQMKRDAVSTDR